MPVKPFGPAGSIPCTEMLRRLMLYAFSAKLADLNPANYRQACIGVLVAVNVTH
jgi:hypothetical protein